MRRIALALGVLAAVAGILAASGASAPSACQPGVRPFGMGVQARTFCGPAKAKVVAGGKTIVFVNGECERGAKYLAVNLGTIVLGVPTRPAPEYFGLTVGQTPIGGGSPAAADGTYSATAIAWVHAGKHGTIVRGKVTLHGGRSHGTFAGKELASGAAVTGSFSC